MKLIVIQSGSKANAAVIENGYAAVLIDCGVSFKALQRGLTGAGLRLSDLRAVLVTHSHRDHISGLAALRKATDVPFYSAVPVPLCAPLSEYAEDGFEVTSFRCSHDVPCVGYKISTKDGQIAVATDSGTVTDEMRAACLGCKNVMIESNHDLDMLKSGTYPPPLKQRILSDRGHLSNADCAKFLLELANAGTRRAVLAHLSENNNTPLLARATVLQYLSRYGLEEQVSLSVAASGLIVNL